MFTAEQLDLIKKATEGFYECDADCYLACGCKKNKKESYTDEAKQLREIGALRKCPNYCEVDK